MLLCNVTVMILVCLHYVNVMLSCMLVGSSAEVLFIFSACQRLISLLASTSLFYRLNDRRASVFIFIAAFKR